MRPPSHLLFWLPASAVLAMLSWLSMAVGYIDAPLPQLLAAAWQGDEVSARILLDLRLPRTLLCLAVGAALGMAGAALQGLLRNPLAEPGLLGVSSGAALGAVLALHTGLASAFALSLPLAGMAGTALAVGFVFFLAGRQASTSVLILAGVAVSALAGALIALVMNGTKNVYALQEIVFWLMGSLADRSQREVALALPLIALGLALLLRARQGLLALSLGEDTAHSLGIDVPRLRALVLLGTAASVGAAVSVAGSIGFVGLVAPHLMRPCVQGHPARLLPLAAWAGAALLLLADLGVRWLYVGGQELRLGVLTALVGAPFFLLLIRQLHRTERV